MVQLEKALRAAATFMLIKTGCPYCVRAEEEFHRRKIECKVMNYTQERELDEEITKMYGHRTYPKIFYKGKFVGGCDDLLELFRGGKEGL